MNNVESGQEPTVLASKSYYEICKYCGRSFDEGGLYFCKARVPYYAVSIDCSSFTEELEDSVIKTKSIPIKRLIKKVLVETI